MRTLRYIPSDKIEEGGPSIMHPLFDFDGGLKVEAVEKKKSLLLAIHLACN